MSARVERLNLTWVEDASVAVAKVGLAEVRLKASKNGAWTVMVVLPGAEAEDVLTYLTGQVKISPDASAYDEARLMADEAARAAVNLLLSRQMIPLRRVER